MGRVLSHVLRWLVVVLGLVHSASIYAQDQGQAFANCTAALNSARAWVSGNITHHSVAHACTPNPAPPGITTGYTCGVRNQFASSPGVAVPAAPSSNRCSAPNNSGPDNFTFTGTCATRRNESFTVVGDTTLSCHNGCQYELQSGVTFLESDPVVTTGTWKPTGTVCTPNPTQPQPREPPDPNRDTDGDGVPDVQDERPNDPACAVGCGPRPNEPRPQVPQDNQDDGAQTVAALGPKLDKIEQAVLGLGPKIDTVRQAVQDARADANADADRMVSAIDAVAAAVRAQGPNVPGGDPGEPDPVDLGPLTPGADGGPHPGVSSIVETGDADQMLAQLDTNGWSLTRSCPAYTWPLSFDLGWGTVNISEAVEMVCGALAILGWVIGLAGLIQAAFILSRVGGGS